MASANTPYIAKAAGSLVNPTAATLFLQQPSPIATVASTQVLKVAYATYRGYAQYGAGTSNGINCVTFNVKAAGRATYGAAGNFTPSLVVGAVGTTQNFLAATATNTIASLTPQAASAAGSGVWYITYTGIWDPNTGVISGFASGSETVLVAGTATSTLTGNAAITPITGYVAAPTVSSQSNTTQVTIPAPTGELALYFAVSGIFSASNANNLAYQDVLESEAL